MLADLDRTIKRTPALELIDQALVDTLNKPNGRLLLSMPPQEGKTSIVTKGAIPWLLWLKRKIRIVYVSYEFGVAREISSQARDFLIMHPQVGLQVSEDTAAKHWWKTNGNGSVYAVGIGGPLTSRPADLMIIDDPFKGPEEADSEAFRKRAQTWWQAVASARLAPGAPVIVIQTRWHEEDLIGWLASQTDQVFPWRSLNIPARADHNPEKGETDVLGREPGEFMVSARDRTPDEWRQKVKDAGSRMWQAMYQGRPSPEAGDILHRDHWRSYLPPMWITKRDGTRWIPGFEYGVDDMLLSIDCAFKDKEQNDYVAMGVWLRRGPNVYLLDGINAHLTFTETIREAERFVGRWPQIGVKLIEEAANGVAVISSLRAHVPGVIGEIPQGTKVARARATTPFLEAGNIHLPDQTYVDETTGEGFAWIGDMIEQAAGFPNAAHDDMVDMYSQAINRLLIQPLVLDDDEEIDQDQYMADLQGFSISPY